MSEQAEHGFDRPKTQQLPGSVKFYQRHLLVCTDRVGWPSQIEDAGGFIAALSQAINARAKEMPLEVKLTACDAPFLDCGFDIMVFPDMVRYINLADTDVETLVSEHLIGNHVAEGLRHEPIEGKHVFVCVHANRDPRCGACGPVMADLLQDEIAAEGLDEEILVHRTSHLGGHEYAANLIVYPGGDWYGYMTPSDVSRFIEHLRGGSHPADRWRGRLGLTRDEQISTAESRHARR